MRKALLVAAILLIAWGTIVAATGGVDVRLAGIAIRSRDPFRALVGGLALFILLAVVYRPALIADLEWLAGHMRKRAPVLAAIMALTLGAYAVRFGSFGVGGADAYGYVNQAYDWASGQLPRPIPLTVRLPFPGSDEMQTPLGYRLGQQPHTMVPTYAPGLPLLMAVSLLAGGCGPFFVVPICAVLLVWLTFRLGERAAGPLTGLLAALVVIASPTVIYQAAWPMSDVPAGALWTGAALFSLGNRRRDALTAGLFAARGPARAAEPAAARRRSPCPDRVEQPRECTAGRACCCMAFRWSCRWCWSRSSTRCGSGRRRIPVMAPPASSTCGRTSGRTSSCTPPGCGNRNRRGYWSGSFLSCRRFTGTPADR